MGVFSLGARAPPANFNQFYRFEQSPANGGAEAPAARGGEGASIARMYIPRACRGKSPCPLCRLRAEDQLSRTVG